MYQSPEQALQSLILDPDLERLEDLLAEFNLFDVLGIARRESQHSAFLAWLLDPRGSHGLRDYFLRGFLSLAAVEARERGIVAVTPLHVDGWKFNDIEVATERHSIDILLIDETDRFVCLIENKIGSGEHSDQLSRYMVTVEREYEGLLPFPIFLTPDGTEPEAEIDAARYVPFDYGNIADLIDRALRVRGSTISASVTSFLKQYARTLRRHVLDATDNIDELAYRIYSNHRAAIDLVINAQSLPFSMAREHVDAAMEAYVPHLKPDFSTRTYRRFYAVALDEVPELREGRGWTESGRVLLFEFRNNLDLDLVVGPGPEETHKRLHNVAQRHGFPGASVRSGRKWSHIYRKPILKGGYRPRNPEEAKPRVEQAIAEFFENDYWPTVDAIRLEFGLPPASAG